MGDDMTNSQAKSVRTRKNVHSLGKGEDDLFWYAKAVAVMQKRPVTDPTSWRYLAAVHGYDPASDPNRRAAGALPSKPVQNRFWNQCQHQTWYFLPWHRGYLAYFEQIVTAAVVKLGGPSDWALPYWNYSGSDVSSRLLPAAFVDKTLSDGSANPLFVSGRNSSTSNFHIGDADVGLDCLTHSPFQGVVSGGDPGFGGPKTVFSHLGNTNGRLENVPHNVIHDDIGGLMGDPDTAALDPIFWLHHSNIDRLWEVWTHRDTSFVDPSDPAWRTRQKFQIHDASGKVQVFTPDQMQITTKVLHGYRYDDISDPVRTSSQLQASAASAKMMARLPQTPQQVGSSGKTSIPLRGALTTIPVDFDDMTVQAAHRRLATAAAPRPVRAYLNLENVSGTGHPGTYRILIDVPRGGRQPSPQHALFAGLLSTFGVHAASRAGGRHDGSGITTVLEITHLVEQLRKEHRWDEKHLHVFVVKEQRDEMPIAMARARDANLKIGRVSVYYS
jgi:tyrosinase